LAGDQDIFHVRLTRGLQGSCTGIMSGGIHPAAARVQ
jgi:hypothetical protein